MNTVLYLVPYSVRFAVNTVRPVICRGGFGLWISSVAATLISSAAERKRGVKELIAALSLSIVEMEMDDEFVLQWIYDCPSETHS